MNVADRDEVKARAAARAIADSAVSGQVVGVGATGGAPSTIERVALMVHRLDPDLELPSYAQAGDAGLDLYCRDETFLEPFARALIRTGVAVAIPDGMVGLVHPRSGLAARHGITVLNAPGTIDSGYRGEIMVNLINLDPAEGFRVHRGDRIAQLVLQRVVRAELRDVSALPPASRGHRGHGASGGFGPRPSHRAQHA